MRLTVALVLLIANTAGAEDLAAGLKKCSAVTDSLQRLVCYDNLAKTAATTSATPTGVLPAYGGSASSPAPRAPVSSRCQATTKKGTQCSRNAKAGSSYCWQHGG